MRTQATIGATVMGILLCMLLVGTFANPLSAAPILQVATPTGTLEVGTVTTGTPATTATTLATTATVATTATTLATSSTVTDTTTLTPTTSGPSTLPTTADGDNGFPSGLIGTIGVILLLGALFFAFYGTKRPDSQ